MLRTKDFSERVLGFFDREHTCYYKFISNTSMESLCVVLDLNKVNGKNLPTPDKSSRRSRKRLGVGEGRGCSVGQDEEVSVTCDNIFNGTIFSFIYVPIIFNLPPS